MFDLAPPQLINQSMGNDQLGCLPNLLFDLSSWDTSLTRSHRFPQVSTSPFGEIHWESKQPTEILLWEWLRESKLQSLERGGKVFCWGKTLELVNVHWKNDKGESSFHLNRDLDRSLWSRAAVRIASSNAPSWSCPVVSKEKGPKGNNSKWFVHVCWSVKTKIKQPTNMGNKSGLKITSARSGEEGILLSSEAISMDFWSFSTKCDSRFAPWNQ